ncbi:MAG: glycerophosphodiester phosphodiesterase family protein, partial [Campylobacterota bacterium]|nr:glycerophosphodiester phosphodiesterase family protein [Campylobacterota bacterium]
CKVDQYQRSDFVIAHRGAPMQFPEHTKESYIAAYKMGAGIIECDVTFTKDKELVCRHSQCDLHTTTNILATPLVNKCTQAPDFSLEKPFENVKCCTSDITLAEFKTLEGKMDAGNPDAKSLEEYMSATPNWRTDLYSGSGTLMTHEQSIELFTSMGVKMTPELKIPDVTMPFDGMSQEAYASKMIQEYIDVGVSPDSVFAQSFSYSDILYWIDKHPEFGKQAVYLDGRAYGETPEDKENFANFDANSTSTWSSRDMEKIKAAGINYIAPPMWVLVTLDANGQIVPSLYAKEAKAANLNIITWTLERSGLLKDGGGWYYQSITDAITNEGDTYRMLDILTQDVGIVGIFSDWPATTAFYANCKGL